jgi:hypothetical protein
MLKFISKFILIILAINLILINSQEISDIELDVEDHLKGTVDVDDIRKAIKIENINENTTETNIAQNATNENSTENINKTISFSKSYEERDSENESESKKDDKNVLENIPGAYRIRSKQELNFLLEIEDLVFLTFSYRASSKPSNEIGKHIKSISERLQYLVGIVLIDCDNYEPSFTDDCSNFENDPTPRLRLYVPPEKRFEKELDTWATHSSFSFNEKDPNENKIYNFIVSNIPNKSTKLQKNNEYGFLRSPAMNKIILFTDKALPTVLYKGLSNYFFDRIDFGVVYKEETELLERFNITKFPTLIIYKVIDRKRLLDEPEIIVYEGLINAPKLVQFIEPHTLQEKFHQMQKRGIQENNIRNMANIISFNKMTASNYEEIFEKYGSKNIIVYFDKKMRMKNSYKHFLIKNQ